MNGNRSRGWRASLALGLLAFAEACTSPTPEINVQPPPPPSLPATAPEIEEGRLSLFLPRTIPLRTLEQSLEAEAPRYFQDERREELAPWLQDDFYRYSLARGPIALGASPAGNRLSFRIPLAGRITLGGKILLGLPLQQTVEITGTVAGTALPSLQPDWRIDLAPEAQLRLDQADLQLAGQAKIDLRNVLAPRLDSLLQDLLRTAGERLGASLGLQQRAAAVWNDLHFARLLLPEENLWFRFQPHALQSAPLRLEGDRLRGGLGIEGSAALVLQRPGDPPLAPPAVQPLPRLLPVPAGAAGRIELELPIAAAAAELSPWASRAFRGQRFRLDQKREMTIEEAALSTVEDRLVLAVDFTTRQARGRLYLRGRPVFEPQSRRLHLEDLQFDLATRSVLLRLAEWLHRPQLLAQLQRRAVFDASPWLERVQAEAEKAMRNLRWPAGLRSEVRLDPIEVAGVAVKQGRVIVRCRITGTTTPLGE